MAFRVELDHLAATTALNIVASRLAALWLATEPAPEEFEAFLHDVRRTIKNTHSENSLSIEDELFIIEQMQVHFDSFIARHLQKN